MGAVRTYLVEDAKVPDAQAQQVVEQGLVMIRTAIPAEATGGVKSGESETHIAENGKPTGNGTKPIRIDDVRAYKAGLQLSPGPQPVRKLTEFEDNEAKL